MPYSICLDTSVLYQFKIGEKDERTLRIEYEKIKEKKSVMTRWGFIVLTDNKLTLSPLALWEYFSNKCRDTCDYGKAKQAMETMKKRFGVESAVDPITWWAAVLFAAATGVPCDDAYHFVYATQTSANFFATDNRKHFLRLQSFDQRERALIVDRMKDILKDHKPFSGLLHVTEIEKEILDMSLRKWPEIITAPADVPH